MLQLRRRLDAEPGGRMRTIYGRMYPPDPQAGAPEPPIPVVGEPRPLPHGWIDPRVVEVLRASEPSDARVRP